MAMKRSNNGRDESPTISGRSKQLCRGHNEQRERDKLQELMEKLDPSELQVVQDLCRKYHTDVPHSSTRTPKYRLEFQNKLPDILFTDRILRDENDREVEIVIKNLSDMIISSDHMAMAKVEIVVHDGDDNGQRTGEEFRPPVLFARKDKRPLLVGNLVINLCDGVGYIKDAKFTDNSIWTKSKTFRLGVRLYEGTSNAGEVQDGISNAFRVKDRHGERYRKDRPPTMDDEVCCLRGISKNGPSHKKLLKYEVETVRKFLCFCRNHGQEKLRTRIGMTEGTWNKAYGHARESERCSDILLNGPVNLLVPIQNSIVDAGSNSSQISNVLVQPNDMFTSAQILPALKSGYESGKPEKDLLFFIKLHCLVSTVLETRIQILDDKDLSVTPLTRIRMTTGEWKHSYYRARTLECFSDVPLTGYVNLLALIQNSIMLAGSNSTQISDVLVESNSYVEIELPISLDMFTRGFESGDRKDLLTLDDKVSSLMMIIRKIPSMNKLVDNVLKSGTDYLPGFFTKLLEMLYTMDLLEVRREKAYGHSRESEKSSDVQLNGYFNFFAPIQDFARLGRSKSSQISNVLVQPNDVFTSAQILPASKSGSESSNSSQTIRIEREGAWKGKKRVDISVEDPMEGNEGRFGPNELSSSSPRDNADESGSYGSEPDWGNFSPIAYLTP